METLAASPGKTEGSKGTPAMAGCQGCPSLVRIPLPNSSVGVADQTRAPVVVVTPSRGAPMPRAVPAFTKESAT